MPEIRMSILRLGVDVRAGWDSRERSARGGGGGLTLGGGEVRGEVGPVGLQESVDPLQHGECFLAPEKLEVELFFR